MEKYYLGVLQNIPGMTTGILEGLLEIFKNGEAVWQATEGELAETKLLTENKTASFLEFRRDNSRCPEKLAESCQKNHIKLVHKDDEAYPILLKEIFQPPHILFYKGQLNNEWPRLAMVGSRKISPYGRAAAERFSCGLASQGITIVSGAAYGIDTESHKGALSVNGITEAVLGCGVNVVYPRSNRKLLEEIAERGAVISEYLPDSEPNKYTFPARNRIIAGMCRGTLVVEAAERSGALITVEHAISSNRDVFAVPAGIFTQGSLGCNRLIQHGAKLVLDISDIISEYSDFIKNKTLSEKNDNMEKKFALSEDEQRIYSLLTPDKPLSIDEIIYNLHGSSPANVAFLLLQMEIRGIIQSNEAHSYVRK
ncbi:Rossmann fold nucleotide-binding protein Smf [Anaerovibrio sp. JC8]|uniref:DNA-processing protein DprA n=1 Tax=Anaerovibrio sp. JC8 TaxID=1240085 RepID=UPI000A0E008F|nr:DNA-processing protein DprA [Anaerovibrio sp. JC8]ORU00417.1 Rossmann fold nucleotide-binding protein Smf [Anaerovibrio sp. JC8]